MSRRWNNPLLVCFVGLWARSARMLTLATGLVLNGLGAPPSVEADALRVQADFLEGELDRDVWQFVPVGFRADVSGGTLRIWIPPGPEDRPPAAITFRGRLEGDFTVRAAYELQAFPRPRQGWTNFEIYVRGKRGEATAFRTRDADEGSAYGLWAENASDGGGDVKKFVATREVRGVLALQREGQTLRLLVGRRGESSLHELAAATCDLGAIDEISYRVVVHATRSPTVVVIDDLVVEAENLVLPEVREGSDGDWSWLWLLALGTICVLAGIGWKKRSTLGDRRKAASTPLGERKCPRTRR